jgi:hypothetical protein
MNTLNCISDYSSDGRRLIKDDTLTACLRLSIELGAHKAPSAPAIRFRKPSKAVVLNLGYAKLS